MDGIDQGLAEDPAVDPEDAVEHLIGLLPDEFAEASCWWQFSSSQGFEPGELSARLWFILDRAVADEDLRRWANTVNQAAGRKLVDPALYNPTQPHYIAAPILEGIDDPLRRRSGFRHGLSGEVELVIPEPVPIAAGGEGLGLKPARGFESYLAGIGGEHGFNNAIFRAICSYVGSHGVDGTDPIALRERLREAILAAPPGDRSRAEIERYASARYLDGEIRRVLARKATKREPPVVSASHFQAEERGPDEATAQLRAAIRRAIGEALAWTKGTGKPPQTGIAGAAGLGKSMAVLEALAAEKPREVWFLVPTLALGAELAAKARALGLNVEVIRGREAVVEGEPLCAKHEEAGIIAQAGLPVMPLLCRSKAKDGQELLCPFFFECRYLQQFRPPEPGLRILSHEYLFVHLPEEMPKPELIIIDEAFPGRRAIHQLRARSPGRTALRHGARVRGRDSRPGPKGPRCPRARRGPSPRG
jgi:hypothetical protein